MMTLPGAPCIYYGDEVGLSAAGDPYCRGAFPWHDHESWDLDLLAHYREAIALRNQQPVLRVGEFRTLFAADKVYAFRRELDGKHAIVVFNAATEDEQVRIPLNDVEANSFIQAWPTDREISWCVENGEISAVLSVRSGLVLIG
jgi:neopullulanase